MNDVIDNQKKFFDYVDNVISKNKKISHAYLIEVNDNKNYMSIIKKFIEKILCVKDNIDIEKIKLEIENDNYPDVKYIYPDGFWIKKEQLINLEQEYFKKSMLDNKLIYVIDTAEKLNDSSANTILKFLEEPPENVIAILITKNRFNVIDTIVSRCQILSLVKSNSLNNDLEENIQNFINNLGNPKELMINFDLYLQTIFNDKNTILDNLNLIENILIDKINNNFSMGNKSENIININLSDLEIMNYIEIIENNKIKLQLNLNIKLWLTNFIVEMMEVCKNV